MQLCRMEHAASGGLACTDALERGRIQTVAEECHVGRAARRLHLTQPPLSRHILALEDEPGAPLFERTGRGMRLLPAGEAFLIHARRILTEVDAPVHTMRGVAGNRTAAEPGGSRR